MSDLVRRSDRAPAARQSEVHEEFSFLLARTNTFLRSLGSWTCAAALELINSRPSDRDTWRERYVPGGWKRGSGLRGVHIKVRSPLVADVQSITVRERKTGGIITARKYAAQLELAGTLAHQRSGMSRLTDNTFNTYGGVACPWIQGRFRRSTLDMVGLDERVYLNAGEQRGDYAKVYVGRLIGGQLLSHLIEGVAAAEGVALSAERPVDGPEIAGLWIRATGQYGVAAEYVQRLQDYYLSPEVQPQGALQQSSRPALLM